MATFDTWAADKVKDLFKPKYIEPVRVDEVLREMFGGGQ